jgi:hypothetical protein
MNAFLDRRDLLKTAGSVKIGGGGCQASYKEYIYIVMYCLIEASFLTDWGVE